MESLLKQFEDLEEVGSPLMLLVPELGLRRGNCECFVIFSARDCREQMLI